MIFTYLSYKDFLNDYFETLPKAGRGQATKLADYLQVSTVIISQTLKGERELSLENAFKTAEFLDFSPLETKYFVKLVEYQRAGHHGLKDLYKEDLLKLRKESQEVKSKYREFSELKDEDKFQFYSDRFYSSIRMASSLPDLNTVEDFATYFNIPSDKAQEIISFLLRTKLCVKKEDKITMGPQHTFIPANSPFIKNHHKNWRLYSISKIDNFNLDDELMYTAPISLSKEDFKLIRKNLLKTIEETLKVVSPSKEEMVACLNIDLLKI